MHGTMNVKLKSAVATHFGISVSLISYSAAFHKPVSSAALQQASDFGFGANRVANCDKSLDAFDSVHMIQLHGQHALPEPISYLVTCFNALPISLVNQWQIGLALSICLHHAL